MENITHGYYVISTVIGSHGEVPILFGLVGWLQVILAFNQR